ncbi:MAG: N5-carboxyaminoimidazole ribonucleotide mutase [Firmicutes bacterium]|nr:N5-carboxyaminoimidazole ribonucleotide mutase [candidate division NPL-UPA2 bacterium]MBT9155712.1 N5-carboxyaminoimidazole ribonucleotide mutase [candidate division NPL-UPA2 bacterium]
MTTLEARVAVIMGSTSDWPVMQEACRILRELEVPYVAKVVSAHRTPELMAEFSKSAADTGIKVIIAGAGGAAHLPGMVASHTLLPVIGVPIPTEHLRGLDSLLSIVQMPAGVPVATVAVGTAGAKNAALLACQILALAEEALREKLAVRRAASREQVLGAHLELLP